MKDTEGPHRPDRSPKRYRPAPRRSQSSSLDAEALDGQGSSDSESDPPKLVKRRPVARAGIAYEHRTWESAIVVPEQCTKQPSAKRHTTGPAAGRSMLDVASSTVKRQAGKSGRDSGRRPQHRSRIPRGEYEVERIVEQHGRWYWIKWKGYSALENTWEPRRNLTNCPLRLRAFHRRQRMLAHRRGH